MSFKDSSVRVLCKRLPAASVTPTPASVVVLPARLAASAPTEPCMRRRPMTPLLSITSDSSPSS